LQVVTTFLATMLSFWLWYHKLVLFLGENSGCLS
jgi:hypothetical protein